LSGDRGDPERIDIGWLGAALTAQQNGPVVLEITREAREEGLGKYRLPRLPGLVLSSIAPGRSGWSDIRRPMIRPLPEDQRNAVRGV